MVHRRANTSNLHGARILMHRAARHWHTALTTQRRLSPVPLKHLAGRGFHPLSTARCTIATPALDAKFMTVVAGNVRVLPRGDGLSARLHRPGSACGSVKVPGYRRFHSGKIEISGPAPARFSIACIRALRGFAHWHDALWIVARRKRHRARRRRHLTPGRAAILFHDHHQRRGNVYRELLLWNARWRMNALSPMVTAHRAASSCRGWPQRAASCLRVYRHQSCR